MSSPEEREEKVTEEEEILLKRLDETTLEDLRTLNSVLFPVRYAVREVTIITVLKWFPIELKELTVFSLFLSLSLSLSLRLGVVAHR